MFQDSKLAETFAIRIMARFERVGGGVFLRRNGNRVVTQKGKKFAVDRSDWTTLGNMQQMYDVIYNEMVDAKVAEKLNLPVFMNQKGEAVEESKRFGMKVNTKLSHPE